MEQEIKTDVYVDFAGYLQEQINANSGDFKVDAERSLDSMLDKQVVVSAKSGKYYKVSAEIPYQIDIVTSKPKETLDYFTNLFKKLNQTTFSSIIGEGEDQEIYSITQYYQTPTVIDPDIEVGSDSLARIVTFAQLYITYNVSDVKKIEIDGEAIEFENATISYTTDLHSVKRSGNITVKSKVRTNTTALSFTTVNKNTAFCNKLISIMFHKLEANTLFSVKITMSNGLIGQFTMILSQGTTSAAKGALTGDNVNLVEYDQGQ